MSYQQIEILRQIKKSLEERQGKTKEIVNKAFTIKNFY